MLANPGLPPRPLINGRSIPSRDDIDVRCCRLQAVWHDHILGRLEACHRQHTAGKIGRSSRDFWQIYVFAGIKQGLNIDHDRLANLAANHIDIRSLAGLDNRLDRPRISAETMANTIALLTDAVRPQIQVSVVRLGYKAWGHQVTERLLASADSFVVETAVVYPTDRRLRGDALRSAIGGQTRRCKLLGVPDWRQSKHPGQQPINLSKHKM
ncbi:MAG: hypothetical protein OXC63_11535 [Aestuariivita sp.]|nr:hypothetical protein [Aestuariivita sp.]MCY4346880.1 hypothetical protein [Aestuariivita sp.]